jgi:hypothetical protein
MKQHTQTDCHKIHKKSLLAYDVSRALISAANPHSAKTNFSGKQTAVPIGALLMIANTQRPFRFLWPLMVWRGFVFLAANGHEWMRMNFCRPKIRVHLRLIFGLIDLVAARPH